MKRRLSGWVLVFAGLGSGCTAAKDDSPAPVAAPVASVTANAGNASTALASSDAARLATAFHRIAELAPPATNDMNGSWREIAARGELASKSRDTESAREACKSCHELHRAAYKAEFRARALPTSSRD